MARDRKSRFRELDGRSDRLRARPYPFARSASCACSPPSTPPFSIRSARATCRKNRNCGRSPRRRERIRPRCGRSSSPGRARAPVVADQPGAAEDALLRQGRQIRRGRARGLRHRLAGRSFRRGRRGQSLHDRRRGLRLSPTRMGRREHAEERRLDRNRRIRPRETAAEGEPHLDEAEERRPDRLCNPSARRHDPRSGVPRLRARREEGQGSFDQRRRRRAGAEEDASGDHPERN